MSVNVSCIFCGKEFEVSKEAAQARSSGFETNYEYIHKPTGIDVKVHYCTVPAKGEMCPACAILAVGLQINHDRKNIKYLMEGGYLK